MRRWRPRADSDAPAPHSCAAPRQRVRSTRQLVRALPPTRHAPAGCPGRTPSPVPRLPCPHHTARGAPRFLFREPKSCTRQLRTGEKGGSRHVPLSGGTCRYWKLTGRLPWGVLHRPRWPRPMPGSSTASCGSGGSGGSEPTRGERVPSRRPRAPLPHHCPSASRINRSASRSFISCSNCCCSQRVLGRRRNLQAGAPRGEGEGNQRCAIARLRCVLSRKRGAGAPGCNREGNLPACMPGWNGSGAAAVPVRQSQLLQPWDGLDAVGQVHVVVALRQGWELNDLHALLRGGAAGGLAAGGCAVQRMVGRRSPAWYRLQAIGVVGHQH